MYRLDGKLEAISLNISDSDNAVKKYQEARDKLHEQKLAFLFRDFQSRETLLMMHAFIENPAVIEELAVMFRIIDKNLDKELQAKERGLAIHLLAVFLRDLSHSEQLWRKMIMIIGNPAYSLILDGLNTFLSRKSALIRMTNVIEEYLKSLCQVGDQFFIDVTVIEKQKLQLFGNIEVSQMILVIRHLLNQPKTSSFIAEKIFRTFELSPAFTSFLKLSLRNLSL